MRKTYHAIIASALLVASTMDSVAALEKYLDSIPNGRFIGKSLGHKGDGSNTEFGLMFQNVHYKWADMCKTKFPGTTFTNGEAMGDPCCTWQSGPADFKVEKFTDKPVKATTCASGGGDSPKGKGSPNGEDASSAEPENSDVDSNKMTKGMPNGGDYTFENTSLTSESGDPKASPEPGTTSATEENPNTKDAYGTETPAVINDTEESKEPGVTGTGGTNKPEETEEAEESKKPGATDETGGTNKHEETGDNSNTKDAYGTETPAVINDTEESKEPGVTGTGGTNKPEETEEAEESKKPGATDGTDGTGETNKPEETEEVEESKEPETSGGGGSPQIDLGDIMGGSPKTDLENIMSGSPADSPAGSPSSSNCAAKKRARKFRH